MSKNLPEPNPDPVGSPSFIVDRTLGKTFIRLLREQGWRLLPIAELFDNDAQSVPDEQWVHLAAGRGLPAMTADKRIRRQSAYRYATKPIFALSSNQLLISEQVRRFEAHRASIQRAAQGGREFWVLYPNTLGRTDP